MTEDEIGRLVVDVAVQVHRKVGSGLLETVYEVVLAHELRRRIAGGKAGSDSGDV
jgi:GxxExxY protein